MNSLLNKAEVKNGESAEASFFFQAIGLTFQVLERERSLEIAASPLFFSS
jgi:hypothetical protein